MALELSNALAAAARCYLAQERLGRNAPVSLLPVTIERRP